MIGGAEGTPGAVNPFAALGLPPTFVPAPAVMQLGRLEGITDGGARVTWHVLIFHTAAGTVAHTFTPDELRTLIDQLGAQLSGLVVAHELPTHTTNGGTP